MYINKKFLTHVNERNNLKKTNFIKGIFFMVGLSFISTSVSSSNNDDDISKYNKDKTLSSINDSIENAFGTSAVSYRGVIYKISPLIWDNIKRLNKSDFNDSIKHTISKIYNSQYAPETNVGWVLSYFKEVGRKGMNIASNVNNDRTDIAVMRLLMLFAKNVGINLSEMNNYSEIKKAIENKKRLSEHNLTVRYAEFIFTLSAGYTIMYEGNDSFKKEDRLNILNDYINGSHKTSEKFYTTLDNNGIKITLNSAKMKGFMLDYKDSKMIGKFIINKSLKNNNDSLLKSIIYDDIKGKNYEYHKNIVELVKKEGFHGKVKNIFSEITKTYNSFYESGKKYNIKSDITPIYIQGWIKKSLGILDKFELEYKTKGNHEVVKSFIKKRSNFKDLLNTINGDMLNKIYRPNAKNIIDNSKKTASESLVSKYESLEKKINKLLKDYDLKKSNINKRIEKKRDKQRSFW